MSRRWSLLAFLCAAVGTISCIELSVDPTAIGSIEFLAPTSPSLIRGDTLRDTTGAIEPLRARVFAANGDELTDIEVTFVNTDSLATVVDGNLLLSTRDTTGTLKVYASAGGLQSIPRSIVLIRRPDSLAPVVAVDTFEYRVTTSGTSTDTASVRFVVRAGITTVASVRVAFELELGGALLAPGDTGRYALVTPVGRVSMVDTTDAAGIAQRILRVRTAPGTATDDTLVVRALVSIGGSPVKGNPAIMTLLVRPIP